MTRFSFSFAIPAANVTIGDRIKIMGLDYRVMRRIVRQPTEDDLPLFRPGEDPWDQSSVIVELEVETVDPPWDSGR